MKRATVMLTAVAGLLSGCGNDHSVRVEPRTLPTATVKVEEVATTAASGHLTAVGRVKNLRESTVSSRIMGRVLSIPVKAGDQVKKGAVLLRIDDSDPRGRVEQARGALAQAEAAEKVAKQMLDRFESLREKDAASKARYDQAQFDWENAKGAVTQARGALQTAQSFLKDSTVVAPFDGKVVDTMIEEGETAAPGQPLLRLEGTTKLEFEAVVNAREVDLVQEGMAVVVLLDGSRGMIREVAGTVSEVVPASDRVTHSNLVRIDLAQTEGVRSGTFGRVRLSTREGTCEGILIPADRVVRRGQLEGVYVVDETDHVRLRLVKSGRQLDDRVEVLAGLETGDRFVVSELAALVDGQPAKVEP